ncbi:hypothetical protein GCM10022408_21710 [Hymenobacter fastidiosus]|uniref:Outer membrane protein beta-barrel domain-containing protein n=1 Tax=Hymenobacter fastidiosus TaxID=486264 RepID=A0ABP7SBB1_9BACT
MLYDDYYVDGYGTLANFQYSNTTTERTTSVSALARYTLTRKPAHRRQVDVLGGVTLMHRNFYSRGFSGNDLSSPLETRSFDTNGSSNDVLLTAGLGLRYRLGPRCALNFDLTTNRNLRSCLS